MKTTTDHRWWSTLPDGEKELIRALMGMVRGAKRSELLEVSRAARKWERGLCFFFKSRLKNERTRRIYLRPVLRRRTAVPSTSCPSAGHNPPGVSQGPR